MVPPESFVNGDKEWFINGKLHRVDGPAIDRFNGVKAWYRDHALHREDGPAIIHPNGEKSWYLHGKNLSEKDFLERTCKSNVTLSANGDKTYRNEKGDLHREDGPAVENKNTKEWFVNGLRHRVDGPAIEFSNGCYGYYVNGLLHREDGPASNNYDNIQWYLNGVPHRTDGPAQEYCGTKRWYVNGKLHREDGPAIEYYDGAKEWYLNGSLHRENGPAIEHLNGGKEWYLNGSLHREDGPAKEFANGGKEWYLNGQRHRADGPAKITGKGHETFFFEGKRVNQKFIEAKLCEKTQNANDLNEPVFIAKSIANPNNIGISIITRTVVEQATLATIVLLSNAFNASKIKNSKNIINFLNTANGKSLVQCALFAFLALTPKLNESLKAQAFADECLEASLSGGVNSIIHKMIEVVKPLLSKALQLNSVTYRVSNDVSQHATVHDEVIEYENEDDSELLIENQAV